MFAGMGGLRLGFEQAFKELGFNTRCVMTSEIKTYAIKALEENFDHEKLLGDITQVKSKEIPDFDILLAGFPCQAFSTAGKGLGFLDTRGTLFFEVGRILKEKRPYGFILENVEGLITHDKKKPKDEIGRTLTIILRTLKELGYRVEWKLLDSKDFGVPQSRKRVFIVGTLNKKINLDGFEKRYKTFGEIQESGIGTLDTHFTSCLLKHFKPEELYGKAIKDKRGGDNNIHSWTIELKGEVSDEQKVLLELLFKERRKKHWAEKIGIKWMDGMPLTVEQIATFYKHKNLKDLLDDLVEKGYLVLEHPKDVVEKKLSNGKTIKRREYDITKPKGYNIVTGKLSFEFTKILDPNDISPTLVATDVSKLGVVDGNGIRRLTLREGLRLFGYPDDYSLECFNGSERDKRKAFDLLGNTVVIPVVRDISLRLGKEYKENLKNIEEIQIGMSL
nr:DNA (cytosine-5-)-methyltransferase [Anaerosalibacter massiliensis]